MASALEWFSAIGAPVSQAALGIGTNLQQSLMMRQNQRWQEKMMRQQNEYNSPSAQRARAIRAGVAPNFAPQGAAGVDSIYQPALQNPNLNGLGDAAGKMQGYQVQDEAIKQQRMQSYRAGVDTQVYMQEKMIKIASDLEELRSKGLNNRESLLRYDKLESEYNLLQDSYDALVEQNYQNVEVSKQNIQASKETQKRLSDELSELIRHNKVNEAVSRYNAQTARISANSQASLNKVEEERVAAAAAKLSKEGYLLSQTIPSEIQISKIRAITEGMSAQEKQATAYMAAIQAEFSRRKSNSVIAYILQAGFGLDPDQVANVGAMLGLGAGAISMMKGRVTRAAANSKGVGSIDAHVPNINNTGAISYEEWLKRSNGGSGALGKILGK